MISIEDVERGISESLKDHVSPDELANFLLALKAFLVNSLQNEIINLYDYVRLCKRQRNYVFAVCHKEMATQILDDQIAQVLKNILTPLLLDITEIETIIQQAVLMMAKELGAHTNYSRILYLLQNKLVTAYLNSPFKLVEIDNDHDLKNLLTEPIYQFFDRYVSDPSKARAYEFNHIFVRLLTECLEHLGTSQIKQLQEMKKEIFDQCLHEVNAQTDQIGDDLVVIATQKHRQHFFSYHKQQQAFQKAFDRYWSIICAQMSEKCNHIFQRWQVNKYPAVIAILTIEFAQIKHMTLSRMINNFSIQTHWQLLHNYIKHQTVPTYLAVTHLSATKHSLQQLAISVRNYPCLELLLNADISKYDVSPQEKIAAAIFIKLIKFLNPELTQAFLLYKQDPDTYPIENNVAFQHWRPTLYQYDMLSQLNEWSAGALSCAQYIERHRKLSRNVNLFFQTPVAQQILKNKSLTAPVDSEKKLAAAVTKFCMFTVPALQAQWLMKDDQQPAPAGPKHG